MRFTAPRTALVAFSLCLLLPGWAHAAADFLTYLDFDPDAAPLTGCTVMTDDGPFEGADFRLTTSIDDMDQVVTVTWAACNAGVFGAETPVTEMPPPWPVGLGNGLDGTDVIETYFPLDLVPAAARVRLGFVSDDLGGGSDALLTTDGQDGGTPIIVVLGGPTVIPTVSGWGLILLSLLLAGAAWRVLRRHPGMATSLLVALLLCTTALGVAWAALMLDGEVDDWALIPVLADDPLGDGPPSADIRAAFALRNQNLFCLRLDATGNTAPDAVDDTDTTDEDTVLNAPVDGVLGNDTDPDGDPLIVSEVEGSAANVGVQLTLGSGALLTVRADGSYDYDPNGQFENLAPAGSALETFTYAASDGSLSDTATVTITVTGVNDAPVKTAGGGGPANFVEDGGPVVVDAGLQVSDIDNTNLASATVTITNLLDAGVELLAANTGGTAITANYVAPTLTLTGADTVANYQQVLRSVTYDNTSDNPDLTNRTITCTVDDGTDSSAPLASTVTVGGVNDPPVLNLNGPSAAPFVEDGGAVAVLDTVPTITDPDDTNMESATVMITNLLDAGDEALAANTGGTSITANYVAPTLTLSGTDTIANYVQVLASVTYNNSNQNPDTTDRTLQWVVNDGDVNSNMPTSTVTVTGQSDPPNLNLNGPSTAAFTEDGGAVSALDTMPTITDVDDTDMASATVTITNLLDAGFETLAANTGGTSIAANYVAPTLTLSGTDTIANYEQVLASVTYDNSDQAPDNTLRTLQWVVNDGANNSNMPTSTVSVTPQNDPPTKTAGGGPAASFTEGGGAVAVDGGQNVADVDDTNLESGTITLTNRPDGALESLAVNTGGTSITASPYSPATGVISLSGTDTVANYQQVIRSLTYNNTDLDPDETDRLVDCVVNDGDANSATLTATVQVTAVNSLPIVTGETYDTIGNTLLEVDNNGATPGAPVIYVAGDLLANDTDVDGPNALTASLNTATAGAVVNINGATGEFTYLPPPGQAVSDSFTYDVSDGVATATGTVMINIARRVWYVENDAAAGGLGRSADPFDTLTEAETVMGANDLICVLMGDGTTTGLDQGIVIDELNVRLHGEHHGCDVNVGVNGNAAPTVLVAPNAGNHPMIDHNTGGVAVTVLATTSNLTGIQIRGLNVDGDDNGVDVRAENGFDATVTIDNNILRAAGNEGIDIEANTTGTVTAMVMNNTLVAGGHAVDAVATAGTLNLMLDGNTGITSSTANGINLDGSGAGTLNVLSFSNNEIHQDTAGAGINANTVTFDSDPSDGDFTGDAIAAGTTLVGTSGDGVGGAGIVLTNVSGDLGFTGLAIVNDGGAGLDVTGTGSFNAGAGTGFRITSPATSTITATGGPAVRVDPTTIALSFATLASANSASTGVSLIDVDGSFNAVGGNIDNPTGLGFDVQGGTAVVSYAGNITNTDTTAVSVVNTTAGSVTVNSATISTDGGAFGAIVGTNTDGAINVTNSTIAHSNGRVIVFDDVDGGASFTGTSISTTNHHGASIVNSAGTLGLPDLVIASGTPAPVAPVFLQNNNTATVNLGRVAVNSNGARGFVALSSGTVNVTDNTSSIAATGAPAVEINPTAVNMTFATVSSTNSALFGMSLTDVTGTFVANGGTIDNATGVGVDILRGSGTFTYAGAINNTTARAVEVTNRTTGTVTFSGAIDEDGDGVFLNSNGTTALNFTGNLDIDTSTGTGFTATGGGVLGVAGGTNTIDATGRMALDVQNTTIAAAGLTFQRLSASNNARGIRLTNTGSNAGLTVTGAGAVAGSGGVIQDTTGSTMVNGIELTNTQNISLAFMTLTNACEIDGGGGGSCDASTNAGCNAAINMSGVTSAAFDNFSINGSEEHCINGNTVTNFDISNSMVQNCGNAQNEHGIHFRELMGTAADGNTNTIAGTTVRASNTSNVEIVNTTATNAGDAANPDLVTVSGASVIRDLAAPNGTNGFFILSRLNGNIRVEVANSTFTNNRGTGIRLNGEAGGDIQSDITTSTFTPGAGGQALGIESLLSQDATHTFHIHANTRIETTTSTPINLRAFNAASFNGRIINNATIVQSTANTGNGNGIQATIDGSSATSTVLIENNTIQQSGSGRCIRVDARAGSGTLHATIRNNTCNVITATTFPNDAFEAFAGNGTPGESSRLCINYDNNTSADPRFADAYALEQVAGNVFDLQGITPATGASQAQVESFVEGTDQNPGSVTADVASPGGGIVVDYRDATCTVPPAPLPNQG